ncbi:unnamed protein product [Adineta ricciae]|nr:unnamed protein product [Adineta ricciae]
MIIGHSLSWYDSSLHHLVHHASIAAPGCNIYHSDIVVVSTNVWVPEMLSASSSSNSLHASTSPTCSTIPMALSARNHHLPLSVHQSDDSEDDHQHHRRHHRDDEDNVNLNDLNPNHLQEIPSQWDMSINGNDFLPVYNNHHHLHHHHHQQQQQQQQQQQAQTTIYDDDSVWYERLRSMATSIGSEQQSSSDSSSNDIQQHHQLFDVYSQHLPPPMMTAVGLDPHMNYYSTNHSFDHYHHHHHIPEYQTMFSF